MYPESDKPQDCEEIIGKYANYFEVGHNAFEFCVNFGQYHEEEDEALMRHTRIVTSPGYAKELLRTLSESIERYESTFGIIRESDAG